MTRYPRFSLRWCPESRTWLLRRGTYRMASAAPGKWRDLLDLTCRIAECEYRQRQRVEWFYSKVNYDLYPMGSR